MRDSETAKVLGELVAAFPSAEWTTDTLDQWRRRLAEVPYDVGNLAVAHVIEEVKFPTVADLMVRVDDVKREMATTGPPERVALPRGQFVSFRQWWDAQDDEMRARVARVGPGLARRFGMTLHDVETAAKPTKTRDEALREGGWA